MPDWYHNCKGANKRPFCLNRQQYLDLPLVKYDILKLSARAQCSNDNTS